MKYDKMPRKCPFCESQIWQEIIGKKTVMNGGVTEDDYNARKYACGLDVRLNPQWDPDSEKGRKEYWQVHAPCPKSFQKILNEKIDQ